MTTASQQSLQDTEREFTIMRVFDAPREMVWRAFTEPQHMKEWWSPKGSTIVASKMDLRVGGTYHGAMRDPSGHVIWARFIYREIIAPDRVVWVHSFSDEAGGLTRHPMSPTWPLELLTTVTFEDAPAGKTKLTLRWLPINASEDEHKTFEAAHDGMRQGWGGSFDQLAAYLSRTARER